MPLERVKYHGTDISFPQWNKAAIPLFIYIWNCHWSQNIRSQIKAGIPYKSILSCLDLGVSGASKFTRILYCCGWGTCQREHAATRLLKPYPSSPCSIHAYPRIVWGRVRAIAVFSGQVAGASTLPQFLISLRICRNSLAVILYFSTSCCNCQV